MKSMHEIRHHVEDALEHSTEAVLPPLHYQWPQLGQELVAREQALTVDDWYEKKRSFLRGKERFFVYH